MQDVVEFPFSLSNKKRPQGSARHLRKRRQGRENGLHDKKRQQNDWKTEGLSGDKTR